VGEEGGENLRDRTFYAAEAIMLIPYPVSTLVKSGVERNARKTLVQADSTVAPFRP
jgi:hypothetical protein